MAAFLMQRMAKVIGRAAASPGLYLSPATTTAGMQPAAHAVGWACRFDVRWGTYGHKRRQQQQSKYIRRWNKKLGHLREEVQLKRQKEERGTGTGHRVKKSYHYDRACGMMDRSGCPGNY
eukprot:TRINITY_DN69995_c0_g1_i1.p2 TRINITY_DN69995_c0_g1~~TRINITY_DN69995_c0_g1_i1.p2  ORF type:complete len:137 (+),score=29.82 TRINITY_DN69995_c0_g1_i1:54-413(+)